MRFCGAEKTQLGLDHASPKRMCGVLLLPVSEKKTERIPHPNPYPALSPTPIPNPYPQPQPLVPSPPTLPRHINGGAAGIPCSCSWRCTEASKIALSLPQAAANLGRTWHGGTVGQPFIKDLLPSGKHTTNYGKSPFFMGNSTINGNFQ